MTNEQKIDIFAMRVNGYTYREIGEKYGISRERVQQILLTAVAPRKQKPGEYPNISTWMAECRVTVLKMSEESGIARNSIYGYLKGRQKPSFRFIAYITQKTGMPFEVAFAKEPVNVQV